MEPKKNRRGRPEVQKRGSSPAPSPASNPPIPVGAPPSSPTPPVPPDVSPLLPMREPYTPELLAGVVEDLGALFKGVAASGRVVEVGAGYSTPWLAARSQELISLEHDPSWVTEVRRVLSSTGLAGKAQVIKLPPEGFVDFIRCLDDDSLVLGYVDCADEVRVAVARALTSKVKVWGYLVLDDTHWELWQEFMKEILGTGPWDIGQRWVATNYEGQHCRHDGSVQYHKTTILQRRS